MSKQGEILARVEAMIDRETPSWWPQDKPYRLQFYRGGYISYDYFDQGQVVGAYNDGRLQINDVLECRTEGQSKSVGAIVAEAERQALEQENQKPKE